MVHVTLSHTSVPIAEPLDDVEDREDSHSHFPPRGVQPRGQLALLRAGSSGSDARLLANSLESRGSLIPKNLRAAARLAA